jgi:hypothetical protein
MRLEFQGRGNAPFRFGELLPTGETGLQGGHAFSPPPVQKCRGWFGLLAVFAASGCFSWRPRKWCPRFAGLPCYFLLSKHAGPTDMASAGAANPLKLRQRFLTITFFADTGFHREPLTQASGEICRAPSWSKHERFSERPRDPAHNKYTVYHTMNHFALCKCPDARLASRTNTQKEPCYGHTPH